LAGEPAGRFAPAPRPPFVLPKGGKSARPGSLRPRRWRGFPVLLAKPGPPGTRSIRCAHSAQTTGRSQCLKRAARAPDLAALLGSSNGANSPTANSRETAQQVQIRAVRLLAVRYPAVAPFGSAEQRSAGGRARSALRELTRDCCLTAVSAANAGSSIPQPPGTSSAGAPWHSQGRRSRGRRLSPIWPRPNGVGVQGRSALRALTRSNPATYKSTTSPTKGALTRHPNSAFTRPANPSAVAASPCTT